MSTAENHGGIRQCFGDGIARPRATAMTGKIFAVVKGIVPPADSQLALRDLFFAHKDGVAQTVDDVFKPNALASRLEEGPVGRGLLSHIGERAKADSIVSQIPRNIDGQ